MHRKKTARDLSHTSSWHTRGNRLSQIIARVGEEAVRPQEEAVRPQEEEAVRRLRRSTRTCHASGWRPGGGGGFGAVKAHQGGYPGTAPKSPSAKMATAPRRRPGPPQIAEGVARARLSSFQPGLSRPKTRTGNGRLSGRPACGVARVCPLNTLWPIYSGYGSAFPSLLARSKDQGAKK